MNSDVILREKQRRLRKLKEQQARSGIDTRPQIQTEIEDLEADIHNFLARLTLDAGDRAAAHRHAVTAKERAWCDGPPHCYKPALEEAERLLGGLERGA